MKQVERASIMRIVSDLIKADGIIDSREISVLQRIREKYGIKKEDEILSTSITWSTCHFNNFEYLHPSCFNSSLIL